MNKDLVSSISSVTHSRLATAALGTHLADVAKLLSSTQKSLVVVCDARGAMVGVITKTNIVQQVGQCDAAASTRHAANIMVRDVAFCRESDPLLDVLDMMTTRGFVHIPVVDGDFKPVGIVNARDALRALLNEERYEEALLRDYVMGVGYQ